jgi:hypothetical protein
MHSYYLILALVSHLSQRLLWSVRVSLFTRLGSLLQLILLKGLFLVTMYVLVVWFA